MHIQNLIGFKNIKFKIVSKVVPKIIHFPRIARSLVFEKNTRYAKIELCSGNVHTNDSTNVEFPHLSVHRPKST